MQCFARADKLEERGADEQLFSRGSFADSFVLGELLGIGSFGKVYRAVSRAHPEEAYAVKIVQKHREGVLDERIARRIREEVDARSGQVHAISLHSGTSLPSWPCASIFHVACACRRSPY